MLKILYVLIWTAFCQLTSSCMLKRDVPGESSVTGMPKVSGFEVRGQDASDFRRIIMKNCASVAPHFQSLTCLYNVDDDGQGNFLFFRSCECKVGGELLKFIDSKEVLRISDVMENLHIGEPGPRQGHRIYKIVGMTCSGDETANLVCALRKP
jgi:hypothetical protein